MELDQQLREYFAKQDPGIDFTAMVMERVDSKVTPIDSKAHRRRILMSTVLVVAAAAAMLAWQLGGTPEPAATTTALPAWVQTSVAPAQPDPVAQAPVPPPSTPAPVRIPAVPEQPAPARYTVKAELRHESQDPAARAPAEAFFSALQDELRKVPGVTVLAADPVAPAGTGDEYHLIVVSLATTVQPNGSLRYKWSNGSATISNPRAAGLRWPLEVRVEHHGTPITRGIEAVVPMGGPESLALPVCLQSRPELPERFRAPCMSPVQLAQWQAESLRLRVLPPDPGMRQQLVARIGDHAVINRVRGDALLELLNAKRSGRGPGMDASVAQAVARYAAEVPAQRATIWSNLRGYPHPDLVDPMVESLRNDADPETRLEALTTLMADYGDDPRARTALRQTGGDDRDDLVRMLAQRSAVGEPAWRNYVITTLKDTAKPPEQRLVPLLFAAEKLPAASKQADMVALTAKGELVDTVLEMASAARTSTGLEPRASIRRALNALMQGSSRFSEARRQALNDAYKDYSPDHSFGGPTIFQQLEAATKDPKGEPALK